MWWACADASFAPTGKASHKEVALIYEGSSQLQLGGNLVALEENLAIRKVELLSQRATPNLQNRHISVREEWLRLWQQQKIRLTFVPSNKQVADALAKEM
eukprot:2993296-Amphidinium_carterae.1